MMQQAWNAADYAANARFVSDLGDPVFQLFAPRAGERVLDLGCGDGALTERLVQAGAHVVGIDRSPDLLAAAQARGLDVHLLDAQELPFSEEFDGVFTNAVLHWIPDQNSMLDSVHRALRPGGRFVGEFGGHACCAAICTALRAAAARRNVNVQLPWYFPTSAEFGERLAAAGFEIVSIQLIPRPTVLPAGIEAWLRTFAGSILAQLPATERDAALSEAVDLLRPVLYDSHGNWTADYTRLRFSAKRADS